MAAENESLKFKIEDVEYALPPLVEFDMDEWEIVYDYSGLLFSDFAPLEDPGEERERERKTNQPSFNKALLHIAYRRAHPDADPAEIKDLVRRARQSEFLEALYDASGEEVDADPPASTTKPEPSSPSSLVDSNDPESDASTKNSDEAAAQPEAIGISG